MKLRTRANRAARRAEQGKGTRSGLTAEQVGRIKTRLRGNDAWGRRTSPYIYPRDDRGDPAAGPPQARTFAASDYWIEQQLPVVYDRTADGTLISTRLFNPRAAPVGQVRCVGCGRQNPPQLIGSSGHCVDCRQWESDLDSSLGMVVDMRRLRQDPDFEADCADR
jgi:hypothetical protein